MKKDDLRQLIRDYFLLTASERNGMILLCAILLIAILVNQLSDFIDFREPAGQEKFLALMEELNRKNPPANPAEKRFFVFDPNTVTEANLDTLDIPSVIKSNLIKYREKGGRLSKPDDFRKLYGMTDSLFTQLKPFIRIEKKSSFSESGKVRNNKRDSVVFDPILITEKKKQTVIELNAADSAELTTLPGIGPVFAGRIIRYRHILGGFSSRDQLLEVYGMTPDKFRTIIGLVKADSSLITPIRLNFADYGSLNRHPYIDSRQAVKIIDWRSSHGAFIRKEVLLENGFFDETTCSKLEPYLTCQ